MIDSKILITEPSPDYTLLDSGEGEKLERFGKFVLSRPDPQALWNKTLSEAEWKMLMRFLMPIKRVGKRKIYSYI